MGILLHVSHCLYIHVRIPLIWTVYNTFVPVLWSSGTWEEHTLTVSWSRHMHGTHSLPLETLLDPTVSHSQCVCVTCTCMYHTTGTVNQSLGWCSLQNRIVWIHYTHKVDLWRTDWWFIICRFHVSCIRPLPEFHLCILHWWCVSTWITVCSYMYSSTDRLLLSFHHSIYMYDTARLMKQPGN